MKVYLPTRRISLLGAAPIVMAPTVNTREANKIAGRLPKRFVRNPPTNEKIKAKPTVMAVINATH